MKTFLYHKWGVKTGFTFALQFFMLISDGLGGVVGTLIAYKSVPAGSLIT